MYVERQYVHVCACQCLHIEPPAKNPAARLLGFVYVATHTPHIKSTPRVGWVGQHLNIYTCHSWSVNGCEYTSILTY
jgi:hypothetical protein